MLMFTLAISCSTTSSLPWIMDLTFQVPMQYCSLQDWTLLSLPDTSTAERHSTLAQLLRSFWSYYHSGYMQTNKMVYYPKECFKECSSRSLSGRTLLVEAKLTTGYKKKKKEDLGLQSVEGMGPGTCASWLVIIVRSRLLSLWIVCLVKKKKKRTKNAVWY